MSVTSTIILAALAAIYGPFLLWYGGRGKPLGAMETELLLAAIRKRAGRNGRAGTEEPPLITEFRELAASDDGANTG